MATKKKMLQAAAGNAGGDSLDVDDVFSTYVYDGTGSTQTITNGIDLDGKGGAILTKRRDSSSGAGPWFNDTERGVNKYISTSDSGVETNNAAGISAVTSSGYTLGTFSGWNNSAGEYASWTFRKSKKFFDVISWTGDGTGDRALSHNLGCEIGAVFVKNTTSGDQYSGNWQVYHRSLGEGQNDYLSLNSDLGEAGVVGIGPVRNPTHNNFLLRGGGSGELNVSGVEYVAYLFAHNNGDGDFGPDGDADIIKCGVYSGNDTSQEIDVGFEPQWVMIKRTNGNGDWNIYDSMRNWITSKNGSGDSSSLKANNSGAESAYTRIHPSSNGFGFDSEAGSWANSIGSSYIYIAIRRGSLFQPEDATEVFAIDAPSNTTPVFVSGFTPDMGFWRYTGSTNTQIMSRITGQGRMYTNVTNDSSNSSSTSWDYQNGWFNDTSIYGQSAYSWMWKRAPNFFDVVAYEQTVNPQSVAHNLGVTPELLIIKNRAATYGWRTWHKDVSGYLEVNSDNAASSFTGYFGAHTATHFVLGGHAQGPYIAYLFASLDGISKVGSYTGNGSTQNIDCGFTSGARFVMIKKTSASGSWWVFDTERGIVSGNDPAIQLNNTDVEDSNYDMIDPYSAGFTVTSAGYDMNENNASYIFYAIA